MKGKIKKTNKRWFKTAFKDLDSIVQGFQSRI
jgi:hypothetical protein